ncbi:hypothetical protein BIW11_12355 [Tropilaelaps mercedesae]|uniref:Uncharacterized protein n=1 Tax=Tropilaelaps mercedesae TaxID=418985 RepID=A0A1V9X6Y0_9ACAR|nr:hypothetical protein BIW11_12355 [Tropilaelaps mercedesae]
MRVCIKASESITSLCASDSKVFVLSLELPRLSSSHENGEKRRRQLLSISLRDLNKVTRTRKTATLLRSGNVCKAPMSSSLLWQRHSQPTSVTVKCTVISYIMMQYKQQKYHVHLYRWNWIIIGRHVHLAKCLTS